MEGFFMRVIKMNTHGKYEIKDIEKGIKTLRGIVLRNSRSIPKKLSKRTVPLTPLTPFTQKG